MDHTTYLEPDENEVPKAEHGQLCGGHTTPRARIFDRDNVHDMDERFHREQRNEKAQRVSRRRPGCDIRRTGELDAKT